MKQSKFKYDLPQDLIAMRPMAERDESRLLVLHKNSGEAEHKVFKDIVDYAGPNDCLVVNDTKVFPALLCGRKEKTGAKIEVTLLRELDRKTNLWDVMVEPARKIRVGNKIEFEGGELVAEVVDNTTSRGRTMSFDFDDAEKSFFKIIERVGKPSLPKAICRETDEADIERYQTIYANKRGAVTVPSAGLHFTPHLIKKLEIMGVNIAYVTLHLGMGNCRKIDVEDLSKYRMDSENYTISEESAELVNRTIAAKGRVIVTGVSTLKCLESSTTVAGHLRPKENAWSDLFIFPPFNFKIANALITNLHLPASTMLMSACAFGGHKPVMDAYQIAIEENYRFFNYGDAMLII